MVKKVAIITNGGDCPGLNAVIRAIVKTAETNNVECYGYIEGYKGLLENNYIKLESAERKTRTESMQKAAEDRFVEIFRPRLEAEGIEFTEEELRKHFRDLC